MSGIIGKLSFDHDEPLAQGVIEGMLDAVRHGRDGAREIYTAAGIALGSYGWQVGTTERKDVRAVADSQITNAAQLRAELAQLGNRCRDDSDSELLAHAYAQWGAACLTRLRGPFVCAIWDERARRLLLARDHVGIRPLYFAVLPDRGLVFASEIRALLCDPGIDRQWCAHALDAYLALGYIPAPLTPYQRVTKLEPAQMIVIDGRRLRAEQYWDLPAAPSEPSAIRDAADALDWRLQIAVRRELESGASGLMYSGGVASSILLAAAPRGSGTAITVAVDEDPTDLTRSHDAAAYLGRPRELETPTAPMPILASELASYFEEPIADPAAVTQFAICTAAHRYTESAMSGHGASVLWAGAGHHRQAVWDGFRRREIYTRGFAWQVRDADPLAKNLELYASRHGAPPLERTLYVDARTFLPDSTLAAVQRATIAAGVRLRFPFLDRDLVQLASTTPTSGKPRVRRTAALQLLLLRTLPRPLLPATARTDGGDGWLQSALASMVPSLLMAPRFDGRGIVSCLALAQLWDEHRTGRCDHAQRLWALVMLEFWFREFVDGDAAEEPLEYAVVKVA